MIHSLPTSALFHCLGWTKSKFSLLFYLTFRVFSFLFFLSSSLDYYILIEIHSCVFLVFFRNHTKNHLKLHHSFFRSALGMIHIWRPWKLSNFQDPLPHLSIYVQTSSTALTLDVQFQITPHPPFSSSNDNQSIKRKHNPSMTIIYYQVLPSGQLSVSTHSSRLNFLWLLFI